MQTQAGTVIMITTLEQHICVGEVPWQRRLFDVTMLVSAFTLTEEHTPIVLSPPPFVSAEAPHTDHGMAVNDVLLTFIQKAIGLRWKAYIDDILCWG